jgi:hypothetical protein
MDGYDENFNTLPRKVDNISGNNFKTQQILDKKEKFQKRMAALNPDRVGDDIINQGEKILKQGQVLSQQDYSNLGYGNSVPLKDSFQLLFDGNGWTRKITEMKTNGVGDENFNFGTTIEKFGIWFLFYFSIFSESIILLKMVFYTFFAWFYKNKNSESNKDNKNMKLYSKMLITLLIFNLIVLPIILTVFFNTKYGLLK